MRPVALFLICWLAWPADGRADGIDRLPALAPADYMEMMSEETGRPYHIFVRLPADYSTSGKTYPIVYLLDGDIAFPLLASYHLLLHYDEAIPEAVIVGVGYGGFGEENGNYRGVDYSTPPLPPDYRQGVDEGADDGGAAAFQRFLSAELMPRLEADYRVDASRRILVGQSRGGHFVLYSAYAQPDLFWGRIASNPPLYPNETLFFQSFENPRDSGTHLFIASASRDRAPLRAGALALFDHLGAQAATPWRVKTQTMEDETHAAGLPNVYRAGMKWLFADDIAAQPDIAVD